MSVSIGVTAINLNGDDCSNLMKTVDMALYKAKESWEKQNRSNLSFYIKY